MSRWSHRITVCLIASLTAGATGASATVASATLQSRIDGGSSYASSRGTTIEIAVLDRVTGEYRDNGRRRTPRSSPPRS